MKSAIFLQSDVNNPYDIYSQMLSTSPVFWDDKNRLWAIYSYAGCRRILTESSAQVPALNNKNLNEYAMFISGKFARLNNPPHHQIARQVAMKLFEKMKEVSLSVILENLIESAKGTNEIDWINVACKKLPVLAILKGFEFADTDIEFVENKMQQLIKIMLPDKTAEQIDAINEIAEEIYKMAEKNITRNNFLKNIIDIDNATGDTGREDILALYVSNLIGLLIQSYDAGRGLLSNSLMQVLSHTDSAEINLSNNNYFTRSVLETLRFDPPVHNTRRILADDIFINEQLLKKGETILVVLAAANRDPAQFNEPDKYNIDRHNNSEHLTFGTGSHMCVAKYFSMNMASEVLYFLFNKYKIELIQKKIEYEPIVNARLPKELFISLS
jgi:cytochrome P450